MAKRNKSAKLRAAQRALRANIAQFSRLNIRADRPEVGPYLELRACAFTYLRRQLFVIYDIFAITPYDGHS
jgi:hypothetical protein